MKTLTLTLTFAIGLRALEFKQLQYANQPLDMLDANLTSAIPEIGISVPVPNDGCPRG